MDDTQRNIATKMEDQKHYIIDSLNKRLENTDNRTRKLEEKIVGLEERIGKLYETTNQKIKHEIKKKGKLRKRENGEIKNRMALVEQKIEERIAQHREEIEGRINEVYNELDQKIERKAPGKKEMWEDATDATAIKLD
ncbi:hypothetical protein FQR65_LT11466 [Abscondita terminalis]|nr:hypothetical protein FQR65_LT11466 [Abscondita terminalis]